MLALGRRMRNRGNPEHGKQDCKSKKQPQMHASGRTPGLDPIAKDNTGGV
jgi:hypothetical protein